MPMEEGIHDNEAKMRRILESKRGVAVVIALWLLAILSLLGTSFAYMMRLEPIIARHHRDEVKAMFVAQAGLDKAYALLKTASPIREFEEDLKDDTGTTVGTYDVTMHGIYLFAFQGDSEQFFRYDSYQNEWEEEGRGDAPGTIGPGGALAGGETNFVYGLRGNEKKYFYRYRITQNVWKKMAGTPGEIGWGGALVYWYEVIDSEYYHYFYATRGDSTQGFYRYSVANNSWTMITLPDTPGPVGSGGALVWAGGDYLYALQGDSTTGFWRYQISNNEWQKYRCPDGGYFFDLPGICPNHDIPVEIFIPDTPGSVSYGGALAWPGGNYIYATRGASDVFWRYKISTNTWEVKAPTPADIGAGGALAWDGDRYIYALKGGTNTGEFYRYDISEDAWAEMPSVSYKDQHGGIIYVSIGSGGSLARAGGLYRVSATGYIPNRINPKAKKKIEAIVDISPIGIVKGRILYWKEIP